MNKKILLLAGLLVGVGWEVVQAEDWPTYMRDNARVGWTPEELVLPLAESWRIVSVEAPEKSNTGPEARVMEGKLLQERHHV